MTTNINVLERLSWRDPSGYVIKKNGRIFRAVNTSKASEVDQLLASAWYQEYVALGIFPISEWVNNRVDGLNDSDQIRWLEHRAIAFPCYPHEVTAFQLYDGGKLTLSIAQTALRHGWMIKDASAWNILFEHGRPLFCDILSFERIDDSGIWIAYAQYFRHFIIPLLLHRHLAIPPSSLFVLHRDGVPPEQAGQMIKGWRRYVQPALEAVTLPLMFSQSREGSRSEAPRSKPAELARFLVQRTLTRLEKRLDAVKPSASAAPTTWQNYESDRDHYTASDVASKSAFVGAMLERADIRSVLDLGCNAGEFSKIAARAGKQVVAADFDHGALSRLYQELRALATPLPISPVLLDIGRPTPAVGWMNREVESFVARAEGQFDCVMALGLVHHLLVSERASLPMILAFFLAIDTPYLLLEWIEPSDRRFSEIAGVNDGLYADVSREGFEVVFAEKYEIAAKRVLASETRTLYFLRKRP
jgi:SAM-dependent methyltransferase